MAMTMVSKKTSRYVTEPKPDRLVLPLAPELISLVLKEKKLETYRFGLKYDYLQVGDIIEIQNYQTKETVVKARITDKQRTTFGGSPTTPEGHETYRNKEHQREVFSGYYAYIGRPIKDDDLFLILGFSLVGN